MKPVSPEYAFSKPELQILKELAKGKHELSSLKEALSIKPSLLSYNLKKLQNKGLIKTTEQAYKKQAYFNDSKHASLVRDLLLFYDYIDWQNILTGKTIEILFQTLTTSGKTLAHIPKNTRWRHLKNLKARGIITQKEKEYTINPRFSILIEFLNEYQKFFANKLAHTLSDNSVILWQEDMEFLARAPKNSKPPPDSFRKTATSIFHEYDLPLFSEFDIYLYSTNKKTIRPEDAILHTLLIESNNIRYTTYALLLLKKTEQKIDKTYLLQDAERLGLKNQITSMLQFLKTHTQPKDQALPTWNEFVAKARDYNIVIE
jgi:DNA-binding PadR family transcriptional regulator